MIDAYIELHASSAFSFLESASLPEALIERAAELELPSIALLDRNGFYGSARFHMLGRKMKVRAHVGAEIAVADLGPRLTPPSWLPHQHRFEPARLPLLCATRAGYQNLCQMITRFKMREKDKCEGAATFDDLEEFAGGLVCLTGGEEGPLAAALRNGGEQAGIKVVERLISTFGRDNVYIELQRHQEREEEWRNQALVCIAESMRLPLLATNGVRYATAYEREVLDIFTAIRHHTDLDHAGRLLTLNAERHLRSAKEMSAIFWDIPQAIVNTRIVAQRLTFELDDLGYEFPRYAVPDGESMDSFLRKRVEEGVIRRYGIKNKPELLAKVRKQVERELALIAQLGFAGYFLIVWDIVEFCKKNGILIQGRGSAANSVVCYALEITAIDPVGMDLLFERFLSESRGEWPDVDLDLPSGDKREQAIQYVYQRYGELGAAMTANVITYRGKSAAREVGKALGFDAETLGRLSGLVGRWEWRGPNDTMANSFHHAGFDLKHPRIAKYLELSLRLQDLPRHLGQHSGGMVICQGQLNRVVPLERASMPGRTVVQWDKEDCSDLGLIKVDLLGLGMMAVVKDCLDLVPKHYGKTEDFAQIPADDPLVYQTLQRADTVGMFQVESRAQMASLPRNMPRVFYDIVVQVAIIRPGPIVGGNMNPYMRRRQGKEEVTYLHPSLKPVLERTLGVPLFQEQLLRIAMTVAGFTGAEAEELRRAVGMKRSMARMKELEVKLRKGMTERSLDLPTQDRIVQGISSFALYGFPESHAASFALIAYASAYFKVHYLAAFTCAMLNNQPMGFYMPAVIVKDAQRHGLRIRVIDVQHSDWQCTVEKEPDESLSLRMGLLYIKGIRQQSAQALVEARKQDGPFRSIDDLTLRVPGLNPREGKQLASVGALNSVGGVEHRRDALWQVEQAGRPVGPLLRQRNVSLDSNVSLDREISRSNDAAQNDAKSLVSTQELVDSSPIPKERPFAKGPGFSRAMTAPTMDRALAPEGMRLRDEVSDNNSPLRQMTTEERLVADYSGTGITIGPHPMAYHREELRRRRILSAQELQAHRDGAYVRAAGCVIARQRPGTAKGFIFLSMEDETGIMNIIIGPQLYERERVLISRGKFLLVEGKLQNQDTVVHVRADRVVKLEAGNVEVRSHDFH